MFGEKPRQRPARFFRVLLHAQAAALLEQRRRDRIAGRILAGDAVEERNRALAIAAVLPDEPGEVERVVRGVVAWVLLHEGEEIGFRAGELSVVQLAHGGSEGVIRLHFGANEGIDRNVVEARERLLVGVAKRDGGGNARSPLDRVEIVSRHARRKLHGLEMRTRILGGHRGLRRSRRSGWLRRRLDDDRLRLGARGDGGDLHLELVDAALLRGDLLRLGSELAAKLRELGILAHGRRGARASEWNENDGKPQDKPPRTRKDARAPL